MINKTKDYTIFKFREDNRAIIDQTHIKKLIESIKNRNLLEFRPIAVNSKMEVIDGQHRLLAAKSLGVDIYYEVNKNLKNEDIISLNISKAWTPADYLNYYIKNGNENYIKLQEFMKKNNLPLRTALNLTIGQGRECRSEFKQGKYKFSEDDFDIQLDICWDTIEYIKKMTGFSNYTSSTRFWKALLVLIKHHNFDAEKWMANLEKMVERFTPKARTEDYLRLFMDVFNWRNNVKVHLLDEEY